MNDNPNEQESQERGPSRVSIWRTAKGEPRWKITVRVGEEDAELDRTLALALAADRKLEVELAAPA